jgi:hypothetical protein
MKSFVGVDARRGACAPGVIEPDARGAAADFLTRGFSLR